MSGPFGSSQWVYTSREAEDLTIGQSLRFDDGRTTCLTRTPASASNRKTFTFSAWVKRGHIGVQQTLMSVNNGSDNSTILHIYLASDDEITISFASFTLTTTTLLRDISAWYHIMFVADTTQAAEANRFKIYLNGTQLTLGSSGTFIAQNTDLAFNQATEHSIGRRDNDNDRYFDGYLAEVNFVDGQALEPTKFGRTADNYSSWIPFEYIESYGTNGFRLSFAGGGIIAATGGTITTDGDYKVHSFTADGTFTPTSVGSDNYVEYLVIGGGGAGAADGSTTPGNGGGGAGGYRTGMLPVTAQAYSITVGAGGVGTTSSNNVSGGDSVFSSITSAGGGGGGYYINTAGGAGGSGGGGGANTGAGGAASPAGQGYAGETATSGGAAGGGGGAGEAGGTDGVGQGGDGLASSITGSSVTRAGGGGGSRGGGGTGSIGGAGGGGNGGTGGAGGDGTANTGSGGGGGVSGGSAGDGGSGIVIIRYKFQ